MLTQSSVLSGRVHLSIRLPDSVVSCISWSLGALALELEEGLKPEVVKLLIKYGADEIHQTGLAGHHFTQCHPMNTLMSSTCYPTSATTATTVRHEYKEAGPVDCIVSGDT